MPLSLRLTRSTSSAWRSIGHVAVDDADAALLRERDGQVRLGDRVHGGADDRNVKGGCGAKKDAGRPSLAITAGPAGGLWHCSPQRALRPQAEEIETVKRSEAGVVVDPVTIAPDGNFPMRSK